MAINLIARTNYPNPGHNNGSGTFSLSVQATPGNTLIVVIAENFPDAVTAPITDDVGDVFTQVNGATFTPTGNTFATTDIWYCIGCGAATSITFLTSGSPIIWVYEISGTGIQFDSSGTNGIDNSGPSTNISTGPTVAGQQTIFTQSLSKSFGYGISAAAFREGTGAAQFWVSVGTLQSIPVSVNGSWSLDVVSADSRLSNLGAAWLIAAAPPPPASPCAPVDGVGDPINGVFITDLSLFIIPATALYGDLVPFSAIRANESSAQGRKQIILDFNNNEGLYVRDFGTIFTWSLQAGTILDVWQPSVIPMDGEIYDRLSYHCLMTSLGSVGWQHAREMNIAYAAPSPLTLLLTFDQWPNITLTLPASSAEIKQKLTLPPNKFKLVEIFLSSVNPFKLWTNDLEMKVKTWGSNEPYRIARPVSG